MLELRKTTDFRNEPIITTTLALLHPFTLGLGNFNGTPLQLPQLPQLQQLQQSILRISLGIINGMPRELLGRKICPNKCHRKFPC
jgi:hypothetical protein